MGTDRQQIVNTKNVEIHNDLTKLHIKIDLRVIHAISMRQQDIEIKFLPFLDELPINIIALPTYLVFEYIVDWVQETVFIEVFNKNMDQLINTLKTVGELYEDKYSHY